MISANKFISCRVFGREGSYCRTKAQWVLDGRPMDVDKNIAVFVGIHCIRGGLGSCYIEISGGQLEAECSQIVD